MNKNLLIAGFVAATAAALVISAPAEATSNQSSKKVGICHATGSKTNPYVHISVSKNAADAHKSHQDGRDIIGVDKCPTGETKAQAKVESKDKCPEKHSPKKETKGEVKGSTTTPTPTPGKGGPAAPTTLPETGAGLSFLLGVPALALAGRAYLRSR